MGHEAAAGRMLHIADQLGREPGTLLARPLSATRWEHASVASDDGILADVDRSSPRPDSSAASGTALHPARGRRASRPNPNARRNLVATSSTPAECYGTYLTEALIGAMRPSPQG